MSDFDTYLDRTYDSLLSSDHNHGANDVLSCNVE